jgi:hypothetical protein
VKILHSKFYMLAASIAFLGASTAMATAIGPLNVANCSGGGVTVSATAITWSPNGTVAGTGCIDTGLGTNVTYSGGTLGAGVAGNIKNLVVGGPSPTDQFMTFTGSSLDFVLTGLGPGSSNTTCSGLAIGASCSVFAGSPFLLTNLGGGNTAVGLSANGTITDGGVTSFWKGAFTTQLNLDASTIQSDILAGESITSTHSGQFVVSAVPEPTTLSMLLFGGLALMGTKLRRRKSNL